MSAAGPKLSNWPGSIDRVQRAVDDHEIGIDVVAAEHERALPWAAVAGVVVRSPVSVLMGKPSTLPLTVSTRCALLTFLVVWVDCSAASPRPVT